MPPFQFENTCEFDRNYSVRIEDDGRVAYAYFIEWSDVNGDVWLYNVAETPADSNWALQDSPYLNAAEYIAENIAPIKEASEIRCEWMETKNGIIEVDILIRGKFVAQLIAGAKPGWSAMVKKDGPLALAY